MARIRTIKPKFFTNEVLAELPPADRLFFIGLWCHADREGRLEYRPKKLKAEIMPYDNYDVAKGINNLHEKGFVIKYKAHANGSARICAPEQLHETEYLQIVTFKEHQRIDKANEPPSSIPEPTPTRQEHVENMSSGRQPLDIGREGKGKEGNNLSHARAREVLADEQQSVAKAICKQIFQKDYQAGAERLPAMGNYFREIDAQAQELLQVLNGRQEALRQITAYVAYCRQVKRQLVGKPHKVSETIATANWVELLKGLTTKDSGPVSITANTQNAERLKAIYQ